MTASATPLEPVIPDPKRLRRTALILLGMMLLGGWLVLTAYNRWSAQNEGDTRPAAIYRINKEKDLRLIRQDGKVADLWDLYGKVLVVQVVSLAPDEDEQRAAAVMQRLAELYADREDVVLVSLLVNPLSEAEAVTSLREVADQRGMKLPGWWLGTNEPKTLHRFIKNELKTDVYPIERDGQWVFDSSLTLIDRDRHVRHAVVPQERGGQPFVTGFDFAQAAEWDEQGIKTGTERSNAEQLEFLLTSTIDTLLAEPAK